MRLLQYHPGNRTSCHCTDAIVRPHRGPPIRVRMHSFSLSDLARVPGGAEPIMAALLHHGIDPRTVACSPFELEPVR